MQAITVSGFAAWYLTHKNNWKKRTWRNGPLLMVLYQSRMGAEAGSSIFMETEALWQKKVEANSKAQDFWGAVSGSNKNLTVCANGKQKLCVIWNVLEHWAAECSLSVKKFSDTIT